MIRFAVIAVAIVVAALMFGATSYGQAGHFEKRCDGFGGCQMVWVADAADTRAQPPAARHYVSMSNGTPVAFAAPPVATLTAAPVAALAPHQRGPRSGPPSIAYPAPAAFTQSAEPLLHAERVERFPRVRNALCGLVTLPRRVFGRRCG